MAGWLTSTEPTYSTVSGLEEICVDTNLAGGAAPQTVGLTLSQLGGIAVPRNLLDGGDFTVNPWQRGTSFTGITNSVTYGADRWFAIGGASSSISMSQQTITAGTLPGFGNALQWGRAAANANTAVIKLGQVIETGDAIRAQGQPLCLSFYAIAGANLSAAGSAITVSVYGGTGTNDTAANMVAGSWTNQKTLYTGTVSITNTAWGPRFVVNNGGAGISVPSNITQLGVVFSYAPVGTAGANDWVQFTGIQLEQGYNPSIFEHLDIQMTLEIAQRYFYQLAEPAAGANVCVGVPTGTNTQGYVLPLPVQMRANPTVSVTVGTFKIVVDGAAAAAATGLTNDSNHQPNAVTLKTTATLSAAAHSIMLQGGGGTGLIAANADF